MDPQAVVLRKATPRIEFSARLFENTISEYSRSWFGVSRHFEVQQLDRAYHSILVIGFEVFSVFAEKGNTPKIILQLFRERSL